MCDAWNNCPTGLLRGRDELAPAMQSAGGEVAASVADVAALEAQLSPALLRQHTAHIQAAPIVMIDGNLSPASMLVLPPVLNAVDTGHPGSITIPLTC